MCSNVRTFVLRTMLFCSLFALSGVSAQERKPAPPHEPLLPRAPEMAAWTITYQYPSDPDSSDKGSSDKKHKEKKKTEPSASRITSIEIVKTGETYHKTIHWNTGAQNDSWSVKGRELIRENNGSQYVPLTASGPLADDYSVSDFEDLNWLSMKYYVGLKQGSNGEFVFRAKHKNRPLSRREKIAYEILKRLQSKSNDLTSLGSTALSQDNTAVEGANESPDAEDIIILDSTTQLPVEYDQGPIKWTYQFTQPPASQLELPAEVSKLLKNWDNFIKSTETSGSPP